MRSVRFTTAALALVAAFAMSALASAAAYAAPEFKGAGNTEAKGTTFKAKSGTSKLEGTVTITCKEDEAEGEITGATTVGKVKVTYKGCESSKKECKSSGAKEGEIKTTALKGSLGEVEKAEAESEVGENLEPESGKEFTSVESCTPLGVKVKVEGSIIGEVKPIKKLGTTGELIYKESGKKQQIKKFKGGKEDVLTADGSSGLETTDNVTFSKEIEVT
jgi:hypothetical protein